MLSTKSQAGTPEWTAPGEGLGGGFGGAGKFVRAGTEVAWATGDGAAHLLICCRSCRACPPAEVLRSQPYNEKCDVYSYGGCLS